MPRPARHRRSTRGRAACRSPKSKPGCAIPMRSMRSTCCACGRSIRSMPRSARSNAARAMHQRAGTLHANMSAAHCPTMRDAAHRDRPTTCSRGRYVRKRRSRCGGRASSARRTGLSASSASAAPRIARSFVGEAAAAAFKAPRGDFALRGRADRIDILRDGRRCDHRLQDRQAATNKQVETLLGAAIAVGRRDARERRLRRYRRSATARSCSTSGSAAARTPAKHRRQRRHRRSGATKPRECSRAASRVRRRSDALSSARRCHSAPTARRLRSSRARARMVGSRVAGGATSE